MIKTTDIFNRMLMHIRNNDILKALNIILGFLFISNVFYIRVIVTRIPKTLYFIQEEYVNYILFFVTLTGISVSLLIISSCIKIITSTPLKQNIFSRLSYKVGETITNALGEVYSFCANLIPDIYDKTSLFAHKFYERFHNIHEGLFLFVLYAIRIVVLVGFLIDIFIFFRLEYFYKCLFLLCFVVAINLVFYILKDFASNLETARSFLIITPKGINEITKEPVTGYRLKEEFKEADLNYHIYEFIRCSKMAGYLDEYKRFYMLYDPYFNLFTSALYLIGWVFILGKNLPMLTELTNASSLLIELFEILEDYSAKEEEPFSQTIVCANNKDEFTFLTEDGRNIQDDDN